MNREIFLIRHSESMKNVNGLFGDDKIICNLTEKGISDTIILANTIKSIVCENSNPYFFYSSPDDRTTTTTNILTTLLNTNFKIIHSLVPINAGALSGMSEEKAIIDYPDLIKKIKLYREEKINGYSISYPNGENVKDFQERIVNDFLNVLSENSKNFFLITHQSVITALLSFFYSELNGYNYYYYFKLALSSLTKILQIDNKLKIVSINIT